MLPVSGRRTHFALDMLAGHEMPLSCSPHRDPSNGMGHRDTLNGMTLNDQLVYSGIQEAISTRMHSGIQEAILTQNHEIKYLGGFHSLIV